MSGVANSPELTLIEEAVASANARIKFFRVALGGSTGSQMLARSEILKLLDGCYGNGRLTVRWEPPSDPSRTEAKVAFLALMCIETVLPQGGEIVINADRGNWQLQAYGPTIKFNPELWASLTRETDLKIASSQIQFVLLKEALTSIGQPPQVGHSDSAVSLRF